MKLRQAFGLGLTMTVLAAGIVVLPQAEARDVTGKVMAVFTEPVTVNNKTMDKVSVTLRNCSGNPVLETFSYSPGNISAENASGHLFDQMVNAAHAMEQKNQFMNSVNGHVTLTVSEQKTIQKSVFWGNNWECGRNLDSGSRSGGSVAPGAGAPAAGPANAPAGKPGAVPNPLRRFGF